MYLSRLIGGWRRRFFVVTVLGLVATCYHLYTRSTFDRRNYNGDGRVAGYHEHSGQNRHAPHPIEQLHRRWMTKHNEVTAAQSHSLDEAVHEYTRRYRRHPPRQFDAWFRYAMARNYSLIDEFDTLEHTLRPYRAVRPSTLRQRLGEIRDDERLSRLTVRSGTVRSSGRAHARVDWMAKWINDYVTVGIDLEGLELLLNLNDEPMVLAAAGDGVDEHDAHGNIVDAVPFHDYGKQSAWLEESGICHRLDNSRKSSTTRAGSGEVTRTISFLDGSPSAEQDYCRTLGLSRDHALFISPMSLLVTSVLVPIFSQARPQGFNDLLLPSPAYFMEEVHEDDSTEPDGDDKTPGSTGTESQRRTGWQSLLDQVYWAGGSTGGWNTFHNWRRMHRTRIAALPYESTPVGIWDQYEGMLEDTKEEREGVSAPRREDIGLNQSVTITGSELASPELAQGAKNGGRKSDEIAVTAVPITQMLPFRRLSNMFALSVTEPRQCTPVACTSIRLKFQSFLSLFVSSFRDLKHAWNTSHKYKYVLDLDGNSFSGRFHRLLSSPSAVIKATIFQEWHDDLVVPWVHYFPLSMAADELAEMTRFLMLDERSGRQIGNRVAVESSKVARRRLREEDAKVWFLRCLIEYQSIMEGT